MDQESSAAEKKLLQMLQLKQEEVNQLKEELAQLKNPDEADLLRQYTKSYDQAFTNIKLKKLETALEESKRAAGEAIKAKETFMANMSHEIRTPMNAILGMSQLLLKTAQTGSQRLYTTAIVKSAENLMMIINDILDLSKIESGEIVIEKASFSVAELVRQVKGVLKYKAEEKGLAFNVAISPQVPPVLIGDVSRINQVLWNLVDNAIKFTEKGSVMLLCKVLSANDGLNAIQFAVKDTGIGIDREYIKHIFEDFTQEDASVTRKFGGTGLGLSISRQLIDLMGGEMYVASVKGEGTEISFSIPLRTGDETDLPGLAEKLALNGNYTDLLNQKVLLVEDNEFNRLLANTILTQYGAKVTEAVNGKVATELVARQPFDIIVMDVQMPVMNGYDATRYIKQTLGLNVPIVALTANFVKGENLKCFEAGMDDYVTKPLDEAYLIKTLVSLLKNKPLTPSLPLTIESDPAENELLYDLEPLTKAARADKNFIEHMLKTFIKQVDESVTELAGAGQQLDVAKLKAIVHRVKPSLAYLKMDQFNNDIAAISKWEGEYTAELQSLLAAFIQKLQTVADRIRIDFDLNS